jgi:predicted TIM-barrel fold metal-dependent hydrolase
MFPPRASCDSHVHVIGPKHRFPLARERSYTPMDAPADALRAMLARLGVERVVLVQPSFYRTDNSCMLDCMASLNFARGIAVLPPETTNATLDDLDDRGVRGLRVNIASLGTTPIETIRSEVEAAARLCERHGWHVQLFVEADAIAALAPALLSLPIATVIDHFGLISPATPGNTLSTLIRLLESGRIWVKISGAYRIAGDPLDPRIGPIARKLCAANPEHIVWGSDWPHTPRHGSKPGASEDEMPFRNIDTGGLLDLLPRWLDDDALVGKVLVSNPARLYDF